LVFVSFLFVLANDDVRCDIVQASTLADSMSGFDRQLRSILASLRGGLFGAQFQVQKEYVCSCFPTSSCVCVCVCVVC
jgi:hypothetical protein